MEFDLLAGSPPQSDVRCDVCIIGAGAAGLFLAECRHERGPLREAEPLVLRDAEGRDTPEARRVYEGRRRE